MVSSEGIRGSLCYVGQGLHGFGRRKKIEELVYRVAREACFLEAATTFSSPFVSRTF